MGGMNVLLPSSLAPELKNVHSGLSSEPLQESDQSLLSNGFLSELSVHPAYDWVFYLRHATAFISPQILWTSTAKTYVVPPRAQVGLTAILPFA